DATDANGRSWQPTDKAVAPARELPHRHFEAQPLPARLRNNHRCDRERIHTINHDRLGCALVTTSRVDVLVPNTCGLALSRLKNFVTALLCARSCLSKARRALCNQQMKPTMKRNLLALAATGA